MAAEAGGDRIAVCGCGCSTFELYEGGGVVCASCSVGFDGISSWYRIKPDVPESDGSVFRNVRGNGSVSFARERIRRLATADDNAMLVVVNASGEVSTWCAAETRKQKRWALKRLRAAKKLIEAIHVV